MKDLLNVSVGDGGKYTIIQDSEGRLRALRYGEEWQDLVGNGMVLALAQEVRELRDIIDKAHDGGRKRCGDCGMTMIVGANETGCPRCGGHL